MYPKQQKEDSDFFQSHLEHILNKFHLLYRKVNQVDWIYFKQKFSPKLIEMV